VSQPSSPRPLTTHRPQRVRRHVAVDVATLLACALSACSVTWTPGTQTSPTASTSAEPASAPSATPTPTPTEPTWPSAQAVAQENAKPGEEGWLTGISDPPGGTIEGFTDRPSVRPGESLNVRIRSSDGPVIVTAYRFGHYAGVGSRKVWTSQPVTSVTQPAATYTAATRSWSASNWSPSLTLDTTHWPPGNYVLHLAPSRDPLAKGGLIPLTIRTPTMKGAVVLINANTTWAAYNHWGGTSLYSGKTGYADRGYAASLDRPIDFGAGTGDLIANERPLVMLAEELGLSLGYATNSDMQADPHLLDGATAVISLGHDEYYSQAMRDILVKARDSGTNIAFLGANAIYRQIRFEPTPLGSERLVINYKDGSLDPIMATNPKANTGSWRSPPFSRPESDLTGVYYQCNPVKAPMVVADASSWLLAGTGLKVGDKLAGLVGSEYDQVTPSAPTPRPIEVLFHSPVTCKGDAQFSDVAYYTTSSGAGVFASGTSSWVCGIQADCSEHGKDPGIARTMRTMTVNLLTTFAEGPAGRSHPAMDNLDALNISTRTIHDRK